MSHARLRLLEPSSNDRQPPISDAGAPGPRTRLWRILHIFVDSGPGLALFLGFLILNTLILPMFNLSQVGHFLLSLSFAFNLIVGAVAIIRHRTVKYVVIAVTFSSLAVSLTTEVNTAHWLVVLGTALKLACLGTLVFMTLWRTLGPGPFTGFRVIGGIAGYLLIGFTWAFAYQLLMQQIPGAIRSDAGLVNAFGQPGPLIYFSFVTLTTVGYGDIRPVHPVARSLAVTEAITGTLYIAILMASLVGIGLQEVSQRIPGGQRIE